MKRTKHKPGSLGPAFYLWLEYLEAVENLLVKHKRPHTKLTLGINKSFFDFGANQDHVIREMAKVDATLASAVRSSVKYRLSYEVLAQVWERYEKELDYIMDTRPLRLPYERCTLVLGGDTADDDTHVICLQEEYPSSGKYPELGIGNEKFICANIVGYRPTGLWMEGPGPVQRLSHFPVEIHMTSGQLLMEGTKMLYALPEGVTVHYEAAERTMNLIHDAIVLWMCMFHLSAVLKSKAIGVPPTPVGLLPKKPRKAKQYPSFEHYVVELPVDAFQDDPKGRTCNQPHKRLHQVRGFWRHYQSGKVVWVRSHWRGDEKLGVVRKDYEMTLKSP